MDGNSGLSDAAMRLFTVNGQTIMLEGEFENINVTNEILNELLLSGNTKVGINDGCNVQIDENLCINGEKVVNNEAPKLQISIRGENNELETLQIGMEEAKALGLCLQEFKSTDITNPLQYQSVSEPTQETIKESQSNLNEILIKETSKMKLQSVPIVSVGSPDPGRPDPPLFVNDVTRISESLEYNIDTFPFGMESKAGKQIKPLYEDSVDNLPAIGHLEGFQIPTTEDELLLPATVNAKMVDGSYQTITLIPQVVNGTVTYTVHFSNLTKDLDRSIKSSPDIKDSKVTNQISSNLNNKELKNDVNFPVKKFLNSVKNNQVKKDLEENLCKLDDAKTSASGFVNSLNTFCISKNSGSNCDGSKEEEESLHLSYQNHLPIDAKIDNLISENENVISQCKNVKYGKKGKSLNSNSNLKGSLKVSKSNITRTKKVKFKGKEFKFWDEEIDQKKFKLSLLKTNKDHRPDACAGKSQETVKTINSTQIPHMNLNGRLEYPNLKAIDETSSLAYLKIKNPNATKQPYFNVLPYPKNKAIPVQKQILPLNCNLQQAKNLINLQKFLETQKLQLKIQPIVPNGNKIVNIRPKPVENEEAKVRDADGAFKQIVFTHADKHLNSEISSQNSKAQENESVKKLYQENISIKDVLLNEGKKLTNKKFLKSQSPKPSDEDTFKEKTSSNGANNLNGIFIKNNPEYFCQKYKDGKEDEHPLGSSENPIQLVQTGHTFHSRQPLSEAQLQQIASILQKQKFNSPNIKRNSVFDPKTNTRIVYRVVYPENAELKNADQKGLTESITKRKRGRHKTKLGTGAEDETQKKPAPLPRGPGRPKKTSVASMEEDVPEEEIEDSAPKKKIPRTRSGRLSRPPRYMVKDYKRLHNSDSCEKANNDDEACSPYPNERKHSFERTGNLSNLEIDTSLLPGLRPQQRSKRNFKPEYRCPTCQKIYLGHTRMMWHLNKFPDHCNVEKYKENYYRKRTETKVRRAARRLNMCDLKNKVKQVLNSMAKEELTSFCGPLLADALTTWDFLLLRINLLKKSRKDEVDALIHELILLLEKLTKVAEDIFLPVFTKESERDDDCVEIDRMEVAIALGLPVGFYKVNNDNLNLLRYPLKSSDGESGNKAKTTKADDAKVDEDAELFSDDNKNNEKLFQDKVDSWKESAEDSDRKKLDGGDSFWLENKVENDRDWHQCEDSIKSLSTKFEPNLSSKLLESSNDSIDDVKYDEPVQLMNLDSNSKDVEQSNSSGNMAGSPMLQADVTMEENREKITDMVGDMNRETENQVKSSMWSESSNDKAAEDLWNEETEAEAKSSSDLWTNDGSAMESATQRRGEKPEDPHHLWNDNSGLTRREKVDETNSEFLDSLLSVPNANEFIGGGEGESFLSESMPFEEKGEGTRDSGMKSGVTGVEEPKEKTKWKSNEEDESGYMRVWKGESILAGAIQERIPGVRTGARLTSTPESNGGVPFAISGRRNSISDFSNINLESGNLDVVLPSAKTLMKDCRMKSEEGKFDLKENSFLQDSEGYKVKTWRGNSGKSADFGPNPVNSEELMKMALESLTVQHDDVISVPPPSFDSTMSILNQNQESGNLNLFAAGEPDALDFNLPLPDHLLRTNFSSGNFQSTCEQSEENNFQGGESSASFLSAGNNIFEPNCPLSNGIKFEDHFDANFAVKKSKSLDDVMEFFDSKSSFNGFEGGNGSSALNGFPFSSVGPIEGEGGRAYAVEPKKKKSPARGEKRRPPSHKGVRKGKKTKSKKAVDYPKTNSIESIINEALFESCSSSSKAQSSALQVRHSSPARGSDMAEAAENYSLPIISDSLDEVENLDFLSQD